VKISKAKVKLEKLKKINLKERHKTETQKVTVDKISKLESFNQEWETKITQFEVDSNEILENMHKRHEIQ